MHVFDPFTPTLLANVQQARKMFSSKILSYKKMNSSFDIDISRIGNTFIRTLTHARYSKDVFFFFFWLGLKPSGLLFY